LLEESIVVQLSHLKCYDTLYPERKNNTKYEILLKWSFDGRRYSEVIRVKDDMTLRIDFSDDKASMKIREWGRYKI